MSKTIRRSIFYCFLSVCFIACKSDKPIIPDTLPFLGIHTVVDKPAGNGTDTILFTIPDFKYLNQNRDTISNGTFDDKIYLADFFFTRCPSICPEVKRNMLKIYDRFGKDTRLMYLSHTIDPDRDTPEVLKSFADKMEVNQNLWHFVTGEQGELYDMATKYMNTAEKDDNAPGGYAHSGYVVLIDKNRRIRAYADGTDEAKMNHLMDLIDVLLKE